MQTDFFKERAQLLKIMAHPTRLAILAELAKGAKCVTEIEKFLEIPQANISQHLTILRHNRLVDFYEDGALRCYYLLRPDMVRELFAFLGRDYPIIKRSKEVVRREGQERRPVPYKESAYD